MNDPTFQRSLKPDSSEIISVVSGLPRSGTSMMMSMLEAGGMQVLTDGIRSPDQDNPRGYYEYERVKALKEGVVEWLPEARGKVVKIIAALIPYLPNIYPYRIIFMHRTMPEILASQKKMLANRGEDPSKVNDEIMAGIYEKHLKQVDSWLMDQSGIQRIDISYNELLENPGPHIARINIFMGSTLDNVRMKNAIDASLYRQRKSGAGP